MEYCNHAECIYNGGGVCWSVDDVHNPDVDCISYIKEEEDNE